MNLNLNTRRWAAGGAVLGALALIGAGVSSNYSAGATATMTQNVGAFGCTLSSTDPLAVVTNSGHTLTVDLPAILSSASSNLYLKDLTVTNTGSIPLVVHWTETPGGTIAWQPAGRMTYGAGTQGDPLSTDLTLQSNGFHTYTDGIGFMWAPLTNADLGKTASVAYTANCGEVPTPPPPPASKVQFIGGANRVTPTPPATTEANDPANPGSYTWVSLNNTNPPFWGTGVLTVASTGSFPSSGTVNVPTSGTSPATITYTGKTATSFTGCVTTSGTGYISPGAAVKEAIAPLALPTGSTVGDIAIVMTYGATGGNNPVDPAGYTSLASNAGAGNMQTNLSYRTLVAGDTSVPNVATGYGEEVAVYRGVAKIGAHTYNGGNVNNVGGAAYPLKMSALTLTKTDGTSWVVGMGGDGYATTNANAMVFDSNTTNRSAGFADIHTGLADTNHGVASWAGAGWTGDNFVLPGSHAIVVHSIELLSL